MCSDSAGDIVATIDSTDEHHARTVLSVDIHECPTSNISHTGAPIDVPKLTGTNGYIGVTVCITFVTATINVTTNLDNWISRSSWSGIWIRILRLHLLRGKKQQDYC